MRGSFLQMRAACLRTAKCPQWSGSRFASGRRWQEFAYLIGEVQAPLNERDKLADLARFNNRRVLDSVLWIVRIEDPHTWLFSGAVEQHMDLAGVLRFRPERPLLTSSLHGVGLAERFMKKRVNDRVKRIARRHGCTPWVRSGQCHVRGLHSILGCRSGRRRRPAGWVGSIVLSRRRVAPGCWATTNRRGR